MLKFLILVIVILVSTFFARIPIVTWAIQSYAKKYDQNLKFEITTLNQHELKVKNIELNQKNRIPSFELTYDFWSSDVLKKINMSIDTIDVDSLQDTFAKIANDKTPSSDPLLFSEIQDQCSKLQRLDLHIQWRELVFGSKPIPLTLLAKNHSGATQIEWDDQKNTKGHLQIHCTSEAIKVNATGSAQVSFYKSKQLHILDMPTFKVDGEMKEADIISGTFKIPSLSWGTKNSGDQFKGLILSGEYFKSTKETKFTVDVRDQTHEIFIDDLEVVQTEQGLKIISLANKTKMKFNNRHPELFPATKQFVKSLSGTFRLGSNVQYQNERWSGSLHLIGDAISSSSEYGDYEDVSFSHRITSLDHLSTPDNQSLSIKKIDLGPGVDNLKILYQMHDLKAIRVRKFSAQAGKGELYAENFTIYPQKKRIENFLAQIVNVDLETLLAIGLQDTVKAKGRLHGHLGISYQGKHPVFKGLLTDPQNGWIQYRTGQAQSTGIKLSDGPMEILNNYLYDFQYQNLSLTFTSDTNYDMHATLAALGYNPNYLNGKPLKLNVNLQQNLLAALQSVMLTYDLPSRIKEKFEKVTE